MVGDARSANGEAKRPELVLIPFDRRECLTLRQAADIAGRSPETLRRWCDDYRIGRLVGGRYAVSHIALLMHLEDNRRALAAYHAGHNNSPHVISYRERVGIFAPENTRVAPGT